MTLTRLRILLHVKLFTITMRKIQNHPSKHFLSVFPVGQTQIPAAAEDPPDSTRTQMIHSTQLLTPLLIQHMILMNQ